MTKNVEREVAGEARTTVLPNQRFAANATELFFSKFHYATT